MADSKISDLTALTTPESNDLLAIVDDPSGSPITKKITKRNLSKIAFDSTAKTANYSVLSTDQGLKGDASAGGFSFFLPAVTGLAGIEYTFWKVDSSENAIVIDPDTTEQILTPAGLAANYPLTTQGESITIACDGVGWFIK